MTRKSPITLLLWGAAPLLLLAGCSRPQPTADEVAGPNAPMMIQHGPTPPGGPTMAPTGGSAGGSGAQGIQYQIHRSGGMDPGPTVPPQPYGIDTSRMSPVDSDGSGSGDRGNPIPPSVSLAPPPPGTGAISPAKKAALTANSGQPETKAKVMSTNPAPIVPPTYVPGRPNTP